MTEKQLSEIMYEVCDSLNVPLTHEESELIMHYSKAIKRKLEADQHETIVNCPEPFTDEFLAYLLINALRHLNERQRHNLALSLAVIDPLFSIDEYEKQLAINGLARNVRHNRHIEL